MKKYFFILCLSFFSVYVIAQNDSIFKEQTLNEVIVVCKRPAVEYNSKGSTYMVDGTIGQSNSLYDVISSLPGVALDNDGNLTINGKCGGEILVDGKTTHLSGSDLAAYLRSMPAVDAEKIDIITNPSAKYDAAGISGIIDIHSKKNKMLGINANTNIRGCIGRTGGGDGSISLNYKTSHWNPYFSYSYFNRKQINELTIDRAFHNERLSQYSMRYYRDISHNLRFGCDYMPNNVSVINIYMNCGFNNINQNATMNSKTSQSYVTNNNISNTSNDRLNLSTGISFQYILSNKGMWNNSIDYFKFNSDQQQNIYSIVPDTTIGNMKSRINIFSAKSDISIPFKTNWNINLGIKVSNVNINNRFEYMISKIANIRFKYDEDTYASYIETNYNVGKWKFTTGLRLELTHYNILSKDCINDVDSIQSFKNLCLFPSLCAEYSIAEKQNISLSYSKRIIRPNYSNLNPFVYIFDDYTVESGNTKLKPAFSHNIDLSYKNDNFGQISCFVSFMKDALVKGFGIDYNDRVSTFCRNFNDYLNAGIRVQSMLNITKRWSSFALFSYVYNCYKWNENNVCNTKNRITPLFSITQHLSLPFSYIFEIKADYQGKMAYGQSDSHAYSVIDLYLQKNVCNRKGTITLFANDIFNAKRDKLSMVLNGKYAWCQTLNQARIIGLSFSWKFKNSTDVREKRHKSAIDEINRLNL